MTATQTQDGYRHDVALNWLRQQVEAGNRGYEGFYADLLRKATRYGRLTPGQVDAVIRGIEREEQWAARRAQEAAEMEAHGTGPLTSGRRPVTAEIVSVKWKDGMYPGYKMVVKEADGNKLWGSLPQSCDPELEPSLNDRGVTSYEALIGCVVRFTAAITPSDSDPHFGFFKRPTNATLLTGEDLDGEPWQEVL